MNTYFDILKEENLLPLFSKSEETRIKSLFNTLNNAESKYRLRYRNTHCIGKLSNTCCAKENEPEIIKSHTIPKNAFNELGDNLISFQSSTISTLNNLYSPNILKTSKGDASTFRGFCQGCPSCELSFTQNRIDTFPLTNKNFRFFICRDISRRLSLRTNFCDFYDKNTNLYEQIDKFHEHCFNKADYFKIKRQAIGLENQQEINLIRKLYNTPIIYDAFDYELRTQGFVIGSYFKYINSMPLYFLFWIENNKQKLTIYYKDEHLKFLYTLLLIFKGESFLYFILLNAILDHYPNIYVDTIKSKYSFETWLNDLKENGIFTGVSETKIFQYFISATFFKEFSNYHNTNSWEKMFI